LIYTAWVKAGSPLVGIYELEYSTVSGFEQNYPNPFSNSTTFRFKLNDKNQHLVLQIKDITGKTVDILKDANLSQGEYIINWYPQDLPKGIYFAVIQCGKTTISQKILNL